MRALILALVLSALWPSRALAQRFGGQYGGGGGFWMQYLAPNLDAKDGFGRDLGGAVTLGGRGFVQIGRVRLGGGGFGGGFTGEGVNGAGNEVTGGVSGGGFIAEYLVLQRNLEVAVGGLAGGGSFSVEERLAVEGDVETLHRRKKSVFIGQPWVRVAYNLAPFVNAGLQLGYLIGSRDLHGVSVGLDVLIGLFP